MHLATYQFDAMLGAVDANLRRIGRVLRSLAPDEVDVIAFPEMCDTGYAMGTIVEAAVTWGPDHLAEIRELAAAKRTAVVLGVSERTEHGVYNATVVIDAAGQRIHRYRKTHLVSIEPIGEHRYLRAGDALDTFTVGGLTAGILTCYELRFPEVARALTLRGARLLFVPAAWPLSRVDHFTTLLRARAIENQVFVVAAARVGTDAGTRFGGHGMIVDPNGRVLTEGSEDAEGMLRATIDPDDVDRARARIAALEERRPDLYQ